jgi:hypothetical protein
VADSRVTCIIFGTDNEVDDIQNYNDRIQTREEGFAFTS